MAIKDFAFGQPSRILTDSNNLDSHAGKFKNSKYSTFTEGMPTVGVPGEVFRVVYVCFVNDHIGLRARQSTIKSCVLPDSLCEIVFVRPCWWPSLPVPGTV